jgi:septin 4
VASSDSFVEVAGKRLRGRVYPWGIVEGSHFSIFHRLWFCPSRGILNKCDPFFAVENPSHSDFSKLRTMLIQSHMHDLKETTQDLHYENFRAKAIARIAQNPKERSKLKRDSSSELPQDLLLQKEAEVQLSFL